MEILTNSRAKAFRRCARLEQISYQQGYRPRETAEALRFGDLVHVGLEAWWRTEGEGRLVAAFLAVAAREADDFARAQVEELLRGYHFRWADEGIVPVAFLDGTVGVEVEFRAPLVNPETGAPSRTYELGGKLDVLAHDADGRVVIVEHKTSSENITTGSAYWQKLRMDSQVSTYFTGAEALGHPADACLYDVIGKPHIEPAKATPMEARKYTLPKFKACPACAKKGGIESAPHTIEGVTCEADPETGKRRLMTDPGGRLYAAMRDRDETPDEYRERLRADIAERPEAYYQRGEVVRLERDLHEYQLDTWQTAQTMRDYRRLQIAPRNPDACAQFGRLCSFFDVCTGAASLDDAQRFERLDHVHPELAAIPAA